MLKKFLVPAVFTFIFFLISLSSVHAASDYVLPYPSLMPGNRFYRMKELLDQTKAILMWGKFSQFKYQLSQADKYLVEAKILFEYGQLQHADNSLKKYLDHLKILPGLLASARKEGKDITEKKAIFINAIHKHQEILNNLQNIVPQDFVWQVGDSKKILYPQFAVRSAIVLDESLLSLVERYK